MFKYNSKMNNFHIYEEVGRGKFSVVYKVTYPCLTPFQGRKKKTIDYVAVKSVEKNRRKKVLNEVSPRLRSSCKGQNLPQS